MISRGEIRPAVVGKIDTVKYSKTHENAVKHGEPKPATYHFHKDITMGVPHDLRTTPHPKNNVDILSLLPQFKDKGVAKTNIVLGVRRLACP